MEEKQIFIDNLKINYKQVGDGNIPIILLHGWGLGSDKYLAVAKYLSEVESEKLKVKSYRIYLLDLPGFGKSDAPSVAWGVNEYVELVKKFIYLIDSRVSVWIMIGHSFGGQIAIKFSVQYPEKLKALILTGAAGIRHSPNLKQKIFYCLAKTGKIIFSLPLINKLKKSAQGLLYRAAREKDYYEARGVMKEIFKKVIKEDLTDCLEKIKTPTLLVWGRNDHSTPLKDGELMHLGIRNSKFEILDDSDHRAPYQLPEKFAKIVTEFIKNI